MKKQIWLALGLAFLLAGSADPALAAQKGPEQTVPANTVKAPLAKLPLLPFRNETLEDAVTAGTRPDAEEKDQKQEDAEKAAWMVYYPNAVPKPAAPAPGEEAAAAPKPYNPQEDTRTSDEKLADWKKSQHLLLPEKQAGEAEQFGSARGTALGIVEGVRDGLVECYYQIPYAMAPTGDRRFAPPVPVTRWSGTLDCTEPVSAAPQKGMPFGDENCLKLNIWTAATDKQNDLPVYVWFHGGAFQSGSASAPVYDGRELAKAGIVVVSVDYRLGPLGFFASKTTKDLYGTTGNWGILDMISALKWVKNNIASFGGDPKQVTIGGFSAGSMGVSALISSPEAKGLFTRAVMESGSIADIGLIAPETSKSLEAGISAGSKAASALGADDTKEGLEKLRSLSTDDILSMSVPAKFGFWDAGFWPVPDGKVISSTIRKDLAAGKLNKVDLFFGYNSDELISWFTQPMSKPMYEALVKKVFGPAVNEALARYPAGNNPTLALRSLAEQMALRSGMYAYADALSKEGASVYAYRFDGQDPLLEGSGLGAPHGAELKYFFHTFQDEINASPAQKAIARDMYAALANFIKYGNPNGEKAPIVWKTYNPQKAEEFVFDNQPRMEDVRDFANIEWFNQLAEKAEQ
jgi:para-nitrobenzyl esterase